MLESFAVSLELVYRELLMLQSMNGLDDNEERACELVRRALTSIQEIQDSHLTEFVHCTPAILTTGTVPREQLRLLIESQFSVPQMADMIGVSERTIHRRMAEYGLSIHSTYSDMTDQELDCRDSSRVPLMWKQANEWPPLASWYQSSTT